jgi:hypothetical protein
MTFPLKPNDKQIPNEASQKTINELSWSQLSESDEERSTVIKQTYNTISPPDPNWKITSAPQETYEQRNDAFILGH